MFYKLENVLEERDAGTVLLLHRLAPKTYQASEWPWKNGTSFKDDRPGTPIELELDLDDEPEEDVGDGEKVVKVFSDFFNESIPLFSQQLRDVLSAEGIANIEYYPAVIRGCDVSAPSYFAVNIIGEVKHKNLSEAHGKFDIFVMRNWIHVSERIKVACEKASLKRLLFTPSGS